MASSAILIKPSHMSLASENVIEGPFGYTIIFDGIVTVIKAIGPYHLPRWLRPGLTKLESGGLCHWQRPAIGCAEAFVRRLYQMASLSRNDTLRESVERLLFTSAQCGRRFSRSVNTTIITAKILAYNAPDRFVVIICDYSRNART